MKELRAAQAAQDLKGLSTAGSIDTLAMQFVASLRREDYYRFLQNKKVPARRADPNSPSFDAERAVAYHMQNGHIDEAGWLIFLMTHFARRPEMHWQRLQDVYGRLGTGIWDWATVSADPAGFRSWLAANWQLVGGAFGNHRKYESLRPNARRPIATVVSNYLDWIGSAGHAAFFSKAVRDAGNNPHTIFEHLFTSMNVASFGRLAKFDYLSLISRYGIAPITAGSAYLNGATGPSRGARLLIDGDALSRTPNEVLQVSLDTFDQKLKVGMTVMEDALCNWQKSPEHFVHFKG